jgi:ATP-dependent Zn protease
MSRKTAYHEAGHAVAAMELGVWYDGLSIIPRGDGTVGHVRVEGDDGFWMPHGSDPDSPENMAKYWAWAEQQAVIDYAGHAALVVLLGIGDMSEKSAKVNGALEDFDKARERLGDDSQRIKQAKARARKIVSDRRREVRKLALAALKYGYLDGQQVDFVLLDSPFFLGSLSAEQRRRGKA